MDHARELRARPRDPSGATLRSVGGLRARWLRSSGDPTWDGGPHCRGPTDGGYRGPNARRTGRGRLLVAPPLAIAVDDSVHRPADRFEPAPRPGQRPGHRDVNGGALARQSDVRTVAGPCAGTFVGTWRKSLPSLSWQRSVDGAGRSRVPPARSVRPSVGSPNEPGNGLKGERAGAPCIDPSPAKLGPSGGGAPPGSHGHSNDHLGGVQDRRPDFAWRPEMNIAGVGLP